jgi:hypothetical protein
VGDRPEVENPPVELLETQVMPLRDDPATQNLEDEKSEMLSVTLEEVDLSPKETHTSLPPVHDDVDTEDDGQFTLKF